jgi:hypothetical protein
MSLPMALIVSISPLFKSIALIWLPTTWAT